MIDEEVCRAGASPAAEKWQPERLPYNSLFTSLDVYHDLDSRSAALNMAIDEALLGSADVPTIRFYQWDHPALSFGYFGRFQDVADENREIVRRWTGGGIVSHGEDLTYSIVIPATDPAFGESSISVYEKVHAAVRDALMANGEQAELAPGAEVCDRRNETESALIERRYRNRCFANPVRADVLINGRKIAGAAQRRTRRGLLQQGSIQSVNLEGGFADSFAQALCLDSNLQNIDSTLVIRAEEIAAAKYGTKAWLNRR